MENYRQKKLLVYLVLAITMMSFYCHSAFAKDLGVVGEIYPIQEEDLLNFILRRIAHMQKSGDWQKLQNQFRDRVQQHADRPRPVSAIRKAVETRSWQYNPSITVPYDLKDAKGNIFAKAGTTVNPLSFITIRSTLVFFNGDDKNQVQWVLSFNQKYPRKTKLILINGSVSEQIKRLHQPIYFDQGGKLTAKFNIQHVPAIVVQERDHLKISEIAL